MWSSINFSRSEFACRCGCGMDTVDYALIESLEALREKLNEWAGVLVRIKITSGNRCAEYNAKVGGEKNSWHMKSRAADIQAQQLHTDWQQIPPEVVADAAEAVGFGGIGRYATFTHVDTRGIAARWHG